MIESAGNGYRLDPSSIDLDADRLAAAVESADLATIDEILARWQGPAFPELADVDDGRAESTRLDELRIRAVETRAESRLSAGATDGLVVELVALADEEPLRERPRALLMAALAASGRNAEALRVYDDFRRRLGDELGIEPSPALAAQHASLLSGVDDDAWAPASRLPVAVTSLVGRDALVVEVLAIVAAHRLVTLLGPGGVGKTRMLGEIGRRLRAERPDRPVVMCELATADEESVVDVVAAALGIEGRPDVGLADRVAAVLGDTEIAVLLDNCEHVLDPVAALVERLLATCPNVTVGDDEPGAAAGRRRAAVHRADAGAPRPTTLQRCSCSSSGRAPWRRASIPAPMSWTPSPTSSAGSMGCRWRSSWRPPGCTRSTSPRWPPAWIVASCCCRPATARPLATGR